jgi:hypothetical protein
MAVETRLGVTGSRGMMSAENGPTAGTNAQEELAN